MPMTLPSRFLRASMLIALGGLLAGCAAVKRYDNARNDVRPGGAINRGIEESKNRRVQIDKERENLGDQKTNVESELQRMNKRIDAARADAREQDALLARAQADKNVSRQRLDELQQRQRQLNSELAALDRQQKSNPNPAPDPIREREKEAKLQTLKNRQEMLKKDLDAALSVRR